MKLTLKNIAAIKSADIELDHITIIAGYNSSGKSTISKALYGMVSPYNNIHLKINFEKEKSLNFLLREHEDLSHECRNIIFEIINNIKGTNINFPKSISPGQFVLALPHVLKQFKEEYLYFYEKDDIELFKNELLSKKENLCKLINMVLQKDDSEYISRVIQLTLSNIFNKQIVTLNNPDVSQSFLTLEISADETLSIIINEDSTIKIKEKIAYLKNNILYLDTKHIIDELNNNNRRIRNTSNPYGNNLLNLLRAEPENDTELSVEEQTEYDNFLSTFYSIFNETLHGELTIEGDIFYFKDYEKDALIDMKNVASGMKCLLAIQRLIQNRTINKNTILIIDEPETSLHPEWQVFFADILVLLNKHLGIKLLINSHSPYFIRAIEIKMANNNMANNGRYYLMEPSASLFVAKDVTKSTEEIYKCLYKPLESLTL